jgi:hypothetical protein
MPAFKDSLLFSLWIGVIFLAAFLCWFLTQPLRADILKNAVNRNLSERTGSDRNPSALGSGGASGGEAAPRLEKFIPPGGLESGTFRMGYWFTIKDGKNSKALVFVLAAEGTFLPCLAIVTDKKVEAILPLGSHSKELFGRLTPGVLRIYVRRIEGGGL